MLPTLENSEKFKTEYNLYRNKINAIVNENARSQAEIALKNLLNEVRKIDQQHQELFNGNQIDMRVGEVRSNINDLRKKLDSLCKN